MIFILTTKNNERGVIFIMSLLIITSISGIALTLSTVMLSQFQTSQREQKFVEAFYTADSGIERGLYRYRVLGDPGFFVGTVAGGNGTYDAQFLAPGAADCPGGTPTACLISLGTFQGTRRRIRATF